MQLVDLVTSEDVVFGVRAANVGDAAAQLLRATLPHHGYAPADVERLIAAVQAREREAPTLCGAIAIPHARDAQVTEFALAVGINRFGITGDDSPRLMFAFLSPEAQRSEHLDLLARLARLSRNGAAVDAIVNATTADDVVEVFGSLQR